MNTQRIEGNGHVVEIERDFIEATFMGHSEVDPKWRYTDKAGHEHSEVALLKEVVEYDWWCDDCRDRHEMTHLECPRCGEKIEPKLIWVPGGTSYIQGYTTYMLDGERVTKEVAEDAVARMAGNA